jgi:predicted PurR-regulated permease PerM
MPSSKKPFPPSVSPPSPQRPPNETGLFSPLTQINLILLCIGFLIFILLRLTEFLTSTVVMLASALLLTYLLLGPVRAIEASLHAVFSKQRRISSTLRRTIAIICVYVLFLGVLAVSAIRIVPTLTLQIKEFTHDIPTYLSKVETSTQAAATQPPPNTPSQVLPSSQPPLPQKDKLIATTTRLAVQKVAVIYREYAANLGNFLLDIGATTLSGLVYTLTTLVLVFYLLHDGKGLKEGFVNLMPVRSEAWVNRFLHRIHVQFYGIVKGQVLMSFLSGGILYLLLSLLGIKYPLLLAIFFGLVSILPVIGPWMGLLPIIFILAFNGHALYIIHLLLTTGLFYLIKAYWLWPKVLYKKFDIHPILFILTFLVCLKMVGYLGLLLSFPLAALLGVAVEMLKTSHTAPHPPLRCKEEGLF